MTDGSIVYDNNGVETKRFHVRDGLGIKLWMRSGFGFGVLTSRSSEVVRKRSIELGITHVQQGVQEKLSASKQLLESLGYPTEQVCYIGDDLPDLPVMKSVALAVSPADAAIDVRENSHWILAQSRRRGCGTRVSRTTIAGEASMGGARVMLSIDSVPRVNRS